MRAVMLSVRPEWCELIRSGEKVLEVRKNKPTLQAPFRVYIYESAPRSAVIGEFSCVKFWTLPDEDTRREEILLSWACMTEEELREYAGEREEVFGWQIAELMIYDTPLQVTAFRAPLDSETPGEPLDGPPQSWRYVEWEPGIGRAGVMIPGRRIEQEEEE